MDKKDIVVVIEGCMWFLSLVLFLLASVVGAIGRFELTILSFALGVAAFFLHYLSQ